MQTAHLSSKQKSQVNLQTIAISATFTAEPVEDILTFWMKELSIPTNIEFAPYNQVFQELLNPSSLLAQNRQGVNILLLRLEDWRREIGTEAVSPEAIERNVQDLVQALKGAVGRSATPYVVGLCPDSPTAKADDQWAEFSQRMEALIEAELGSVSGLFLLKPQDFAAYPVTDYYDAQRDRLGHIPFTSLFFTALGTLLARRIYTLKSSPHKVIVLDCDNTIWKGVVGEDGVAGIEITPAYAALQEFMIAQQKAGMVICLCSKNIESDVLEVFDQRHDMALKREHLVSWRVNWMPKSENIRSLAEELNLGLDSFIFIDDNPVECAEMRSACPEVLTLQLPINGDIPNFLSHVWAFDHLKVTEEDKQRTEMYKQNLERDRFQRQALTIDDFMAGLGLVIEISEPTPEQLPRVAQLTQRTNQFNFTTVRRSEAEVQQLAEAGLECRVVQVSDRFGDYGLVGVIIFGHDDAAVTVDTFLLSCRVLGRGVEHKMLNHLAEFAQTQNLNFVKAPFIRTKKNLPALNFLEGVAADYQQPTEDGFQFCLPTEAALAIAYAPGGNHAEPTSEAAAKPKTAANPAAVAAFNKSEQLGQIANQLHSPEQIFQAIAAQQQLTQRDLDQPYIAPRTEIERQLAALWAELLRLESVGIQDNYFELGGTSLLAVEVVTKIENRLGKKLPLTAIVEAPTIEQLAQRLSQTGEMDCLVLLRAGGSQPAIFFVHDGDGETLLYRNLANRLSPEHPVYGLQPYANEHAPMLHTRISDMAAHYIQRMRKVQPQGPYLVGGMCAGGVIAFEIAQQLQHQGQVVALVALIDAADVAAPKRTGRIAGQRLKRFSSSLGGEKRQSSIQKIWAIALKIGRKIINLITYEVRTKIKRLRDQSRMKEFRRRVDKGMTLPKSFHNLSVRTVYLFAEQEYTPKERFQGELTLFRATAGEGADEPWISVYSDSLFGWGDRTTQGVCTYDIPGGHASMLQEPNVHVMAEKMQAYIDTALEKAKG